MDYLVVLIHSFNLDLKMCSLIPTGLLPALTNKQ